MTRAEFNKIVKNVLNTADCPLCGYGGFWSVRSDGTDCCESNARKLVLKILKAAGVKIDPRHMPKMK